MNQEKLLDDGYWSKRYSNADATWDIGEISTPLKTYIDQLTNKELRILIPGGGNSYEADYLCSVGFKHIVVVDISSKVIEQLKQNWAKNQSIQVFHEDFFEHEGQYDLIIEQTFFCALIPSLRINYVHKMKELLAPKGKLVGVLFNKIFEKEGPPFGGYKADYQNLFANDFQLNVFEPCYNSIPPREKSELFINITKI